MEISLPNFSEFKDVGWRIELSTRPFAGDLTKGRPFSERDAKREHNNRLRQSFLFSLIPRDTRSIRAVPSRCQLP